MSTFTDDFNRADNTNLGANWVEVSGDWSIISNQLSSGSAGGTIILRATGAMDTSDHYVQITIAATAAVSHGVWARGNSNITQGYLLRNNGSSWDVFSVVGGSFTVIGTYAVAAVAGDIAKLQVVGTAIKAYINGTLRISVTDTAVATGTSVGVRAESTSSLRFDDFAAGDVTAGATLPVASEIDTAQALVGAKAQTPTLAAEQDATQSLTGAKAATVGVASAVESGQALAGSKTVTLSPSASTEAAQPLTGAKTATLAAAAATDAAQAVAGSKAAPLGIAGAVETAQPLVGSKAAILGTALETAAAQALPGAKTAPLPVTAQIETAQPLASALSVSLNPAAMIETARPLPGAKTATLIPALETSAARPLVTPSADDIDVTVGQPYSPWSVGAPQRQAWPVTEPQPEAWLVGQPQ